MALSVSSRDLTARYLFTDVAVTRPTQYWLALHTSNPTDAGGGTEVSGGSYVRVRVYLDVTGGTATAASKATVRGIVEFPRATATWGTVTAASLYSAQTGGDLLLWAPLTLAKNISLGDVFRQETYVFELI